MTTFHLPFCSFKYIDLVASFVSSYIWNITFFPLILLCTALLAMSCIIFSCKKEKGVNDSATESKVIAITETKEVDTTVAKKNVETKNQIYTDEQISEAEKVASDYYKNFAHKVKDLKFKMKLLLF